MPAALGQSAVLLAVGVHVLVAGVQQLRSPPEIPPGSLSCSASSASPGTWRRCWCSPQAGPANLNMRAAFRGVVNDALGSVAVIVAAIVIATAGWQRADAVAGLLIGAMILPRAALLL